MMTLAGSMRLNIKAGKVESDHTVPLKEEHL